jgi:serine/threonine-protein kinase HipA
MTRHDLAVFDNAARVGTLGYESRDETFSFDYDATWKDRRDGYAISPHIPLRGEAPASSTIRRFLENLLPEGRALDIVSTVNQVSKNNIYGLIRELGRETTGALIFLEDGATPGQRKPTLREVTRKELAHRIAERGALPLQVWDGKVRMSIAGYQDKLALYVQGDRMFLVEGRLASTHILKPEPLEGRLPMLVVNEHFCMSLAARLQLPAAEVDILRLPAPVLVVRRFDRRTVEQGVQRLHVIDACQALNFPVAYKYERNFGSGRDVRQIREGVSLPRLLSIGDMAVQSAPTKLNLLRWAIFQYLIGNSDAHGKNVSFFCGPEGLALAPFYDLVSVVQYPDIDHEMAMAYGDEFALEAVRPYDWAVLAERIGIPRSVLIRNMRVMADKTLAQLPAQEADPGYLPEEQAFIQQLAEFIRKQAHALNEAADLVREVVLE